MSINIVSLGIALSVLLSIFYYWSTAGLRWLKVAYYGAIINGILLVYVNWLLSGFGTIYEISLWPPAEISQTQDTWATNLFSILSVWMVFQGIKGVLRIRAEGRSQDWKDKS